MRSRAHLAVCALTVLLAVAACSPRPKLERLADDAVVLAFGDSLTYGTGADENESYPAQLERLIGRRVIRAGIPGGGNDFLNRLGNAQAEQNVREMVKLALNGGVQVVLIGTPEPLKTL